MKMYCTMIFYFQEIGLVTSEQLKDLINDINEICHTDYQKFEINLDSPFVTNCIYSKIKKCEQINEYDGNLVKEVLYDKTRLMLFVAAYNDPDSVCERITIRCTHPNNYTPRVSVNFKADNDAISVLNKYKMIFSLFKGIAWEVDNSLLCCYKSPSFPWALNGIHYNLSIGKERKIAIEHESKHFKRQYIGNIQDVYQANTISKDHLSKEKFNTLEEICGKKCELIDGNYFFDCLKYDDSLQIDKSKRKKIRELFLCD